VGGTSIHSVKWSLGAASETGWQYSGGGTSTGFALPSWQANYPQIAANNAYRAVPDVAAVADNQASALSVYYKQQWLMAGGTSASSPIWAGFSALFGQYLANKGQSLSTLIKNTPGGFNGLLYRTSMTTGSSPSIIDITSGANNLSQSPCPVCSAGVGYDDVTGLGVPSLTNFLANF
jgi:kumamolisin